MKLPFFIAEIGINHNGDIKIAKQLIDQAKEAGFDAVKFQKRDINLVYKEDFLKQERNSPWGKTQREQKQGLEFGKKEYDEIDNYCTSKKLIWFASAWDLNSLKFLEQYKLKYNKIASAMIIDLNFLKEVAKQKKYTFISTGMSTYDDIKNAVEIFKKNQCPFELMHCVSTYPTKPTDLNLLTINALRKEFNCDVGYSGHENGIVVSVAASMMNVTSIERHITLDRTMYGSDQSASLEFKGFKEMISGIKKVKDAIGEEKLGYVNEDEKVIARKLREHIKI